MESQKYQPSLYQVSEIQLSYRPKFKASTRLMASCSKEAYNILEENRDEGKIDFVEQFKLLLLNRANKVMGIFEVSLGGVSGTVADSKIIFAAALKASVSSIILSKNHPSGNLNPARQISC